jgi:Ion channel
LMARALADRPRVFRSRVARLRAAHRYRAVLILIMVSFVFASVAGDATWTTSVLLVLQSVTLATAVWTAGLARADSRLIIALLAAAAATAVGLLASTKPALEGTSGVLSALLVVATIVVVAIGVVDQGEVNEQSVSGAICIYLLIGMVFLFVYNAVAAIGAGDFFAQGTDGTRAIRLYFSYVTLATLGYGDYTPASNLGHTLAVLEALFGQIYLVTVVALLVSRMRGRREN